MSHSHHDDSHSNEQKPVSFTVPFILASVLLFIIIMFLSLCDPKGHHAESDCEKANCSQECKEACAKGDHSLHPASMSEGHDVAKEEMENKSESSESNEGATPVDSTVTEAPAHH